MIDSIQLNKLENDLWEAADQLRANSKLTAAEYSMPVLGLIFLRHAYNRFLIVKEKIEPTLPSRGGVKRPLAKNDFLSQKAIFLPEIARFDYLVNLPESKDAGEAINEAMKSIEEEYTNLQGVLPRNFNIFDNDLLRELLRIFNKEALKNANGDLIGKIYEFFLNKFAMSGAQEGGEFFTPTSLVKLIVNVIQPNHGIVLDPACGSAGMMVQTGHFIEDEGADPNEKITFYGQEKTDTNTKLAKMNLAVHGLEGDVQEGNTFYEDKHNLIGKCDFVMANPPFNVDGVDKGKDFVKKDARLPFGLPKNDNANYLWLQYFYTYLNKNGRAGFVMASSASDAGHSEKLIRQKLIETGAVDIMVGIGNNFFYTRTLPCTIYFYDRAKETDKNRKDKILMLDARKIYRKVTSKVNDFSPEQHQNINAIVQMYKGNNEPFAIALKEYIYKASDIVSECEEARKKLNLGLGKLYVNLLQWENDSTLTKEQQKTIYNLKLAEPSTNFFNTISHFDKSCISLFDKIDSENDKAFNEYSKAQKANKITPVLKNNVLKTLNELAKHFEKTAKEYKSIINDGNTLLSLCEKDFKTLNSKAFKELELNTISKQIETLYKSFNDTLHQFKYQLKNAEWLHHRFENGIYNDVEGLCKIVGNKEIAEKEYSLTPGRYVGTTNVVDDDFDYETKLGEIKIELGGLNDEAIELAKLIQTNLEEIGI